MTVDNSISLAVEVDEDFKFPLIDRSEDMCPEDENPGANRKSILLALILHDGRCVRSFRSVQCADDPVPEKFLDS